MRCAAASSVAALPSHSIAASGFSNAAKLRFIDCR